MPTFVPSSPSHSNYGYEDDRVAAQVMLTSYNTSRGYGAVARPNVPFPIGAVISVAGGLINTGIGVAAAGAGRKGQLAQTEAEIEAARALAAGQSQVAEIESKQTQTVAMYIAGAVVASMAIGGLVFLGAKALGAD